MRRLRTILRSTRLTTHERETLRAELFRQMHAHPAVSGVVIPVRPPGVAAWFAMVHRWLPHPAMGAAVAGLCVLLAGGGVAAAAERTLPGEFLYPVKIHVNEEVRAAFTIRPRARAQWDARRAERRLEEMETLLAAGRLDGGTRDVLADRFVRHARSATDAMRTIVAGDPSDAAADLRVDFDGTLRAHDMVLARWEQRDAERLRGVRGHVRAVLADTQEETLPVPGGEAPAPPAALVERRLHRAEEAIARATQALAKMRAEVQPAAVADAQAALAQANQLFRAAQQAVAAQDGATAVLRADAALRSARSVPALLRVDGTLHLRLPAVTTEADPPSEKKSRRGESSDDDLSPGLRPSPDAMPALRERRGGAARGSLLLPVPPVRVGSESETPAGLRGRESSERPREQRDGARRSREQRNVLPKIEVKE
ncbi:hypothetical protein HY632_04415 [Candidatus Uhrbacteria bacterium]|nr:hypothetical protein [Candidatus Uhrbacteria bacterium]